MAIRISKRMKLKNKCGVCGGVTHIDDSLKNIYKIMRDLGKEKARSREYYYVIDFNKFKHLLKGECKL